MAETEKAANTAVPSKGDAAPGDRVAMLSLRADGTPDQTNPAIIGDKEFAVSAAKRQFAEQAVSAVDDAKRTADAVDAAAVSVVDQDPTIAEHAATLDKVQSAAEKRAESVVNSLQG